MTKEEYKKERDDLNEQISILSQKRADLEAAFMESISPFKVGDIIQFGSRAYKRKGRVVRVKSWVTDEPMWVVVIVRKNGTDGDYAEVRPYQNPTKL